MAGAASVAVICGIAYWFVDSGDTPQQPEERVTRHPERNGAPAASSQNGLNTLSRKNHPVSGNPVMSGAGQVPAPVAPRGRPDEDIALPLVFRGSGAADSALDPQQQEIVRQIQEDFAATISRAGGDPSSAEYRGNWIKAKIVADAKLRQQLGTQGWLLYSRAQSQTEYAESQGTRAAPPAR